MRSLSRPFLFLLAPLALAACSHNAKKECLEADYYEMGLKDGKAGKNADRLGEAQERCGKEDVLVDADKYTYGRTVGLAEYCDEGRAKSDARKGNKSQVCLDEKVPPYTMAYSRELDELREDRQKELEKVQKNKNKLQSRQEKLEGELHQIDQQKSVTQ